jgi:starch phosphorylase
MFDDYINRFYHPLANRSKRLTANNYTKAKELAAWKEEVASHWDEIEVVSVNLDENALNRGLEIGEILNASFVLDRRQLKGNIGAEIVRMHTDLQTNSDVIKVYPMHLEKTEGSKLYFSIDLKISETGNFKFGLRVYPDNPDIPHRMDFAYVKWINI